MRCAACHIITKSNCVRAGYRLIYRVEDETVTVLVIAIGKRERSELYEAARARRDLDI
jgi:ParE toxin of type II toxin-antitoxin system, parDE